MGLSPLLLLGVPGRALLRLHRTGRAALMRPVTWWTCARINAVRWAGVGALVGLVLTGWVRVRSR